MAWLQIGIGFIVLIWSADRLVSSSAQLAHQLGVKPIVIGLTIIGFGTSAPEIFVSINASLTGNADIAIGNAIGSNIANIGLVIGFCSLLKPILLPSECIKKELLILLIITIIISGLISLVGFYFWVSFILIFILAGFFYWLIHNQKQNKEIIEDDSNIISTKKEPYSKLIILLLLSLALLIVSSKVLVEGSVTIAKQFGVSETFIGLTLVAIGTSLPELATSIVSIIKKHNGITIGNIIGSNIFNLTAVLIPVSLISKSTNISTEVMYRDVPTMLFLTILFCLPTFGFKNAKYAFNRLGGGILFLLYIGYLTILFVSIV